MCNEKEVRVNGHIIRDVCGCEICFFKMTLIDSCSVQYEIFERLGFFCPIERQDIARFCTSHLVSDLCNPDRY